MSWQAPSDAAQDVPAPVHVAAPLRLDRDVNRHYGTLVAGGSCRIRIFTAIGRTPVVLCSQITARPNWCISAVAEYLAASTVARYLPRRFDEPEPAIWLEHYPLDPVRQQRGAGRLDLSRVTFTDWRPVIGQLAGSRHVRIGEPAWHPLTPLDAAALLGPLLDLLD
jgi:hypothetical protein